MICRLIFKNIIDTISAMRAFYNLTFQQANYLQTFLPPKYSFQTVKTDTKRQRSAKKMDDIFTDDFGPLSKKITKLKTSNNPDNAHVQIQASSRCEANKSIKGKNSSDDFI